jgi:hypothetical protein
MKSLQELNTALFSCYAITSAKTNISIYLKLPNEEILFEDYEVFDAGDKTIIAFYDLNKTNSDYAYKIVSDEITEWIQSITFNQISYITKKLYNISKSAFYLTNSIPVAAAIQNQDQLSIHGENRCDTYQYGPLAFPDETNFGGPSLDPSFHNVSNINKFLMTINSLGNIHILFFEYKEFNDDSFRSFFGAVGAAKTLMGIMRLIIEWAESCEEPWNNEQLIATRCRQALQDLDMPQSVIEEIKNYNPPMVIARYASGDQDCRSAVEESVDLSPLFKDWLYSKIRYETLNELASNNPNAVVISDDVLNLEKQEVYYYLYRYLLAQNLNLEDYTLSQIESMIANKEIVTVDYEGKNIIQYLEKAKDIFGE